MIERVTKRSAMMVVICGLWSGTLALQAAAAAPKLSAAQILERNEAARGGLEAWRKIQTMIWVGHLQSNAAGAPAVTFMLRMGRPDRMRFEIVLDNDRSIRAFDGKEGWKVRPPGAGRAQLAPFTPDEVRFAKDAPGIDGPLIDHEAKGIGVELQGTDEIEGHQAYRLLVKLPSGTTRHVWVDAATFLDIRYDREVLGPGGREGIVFVYNRDYRAVDGLQVPMTIETQSADGRPGDKMVIDRALLNPPLEDGEFSRPGGGLGRRAQELGPSDRPPSRSVPPAPEAGTAPK